MDLRGKADRTEEDADHTEEDAGRKVGDTVVAQSIDLAVGDAKRMQLPHGLHLSWIRSHVDGFE